MKAALLRRLTNPHKRYSANLFFQLCSFLYEPYLQALLHRLAAHRLFHLLRRLLPYPRIDFRRDFEPPQGLLVLTAAAVMASWAVVVLPTPPLGSKAATAVRMR